MEKRTEVKTFKVKMTCSKCRIGDMIYTGHSISSCYAHKCNNCDHQSRHKEIYPKIEYEEIENTYTVNIDYSGFSASKSNCNCGLCPDCLGHD